MVTSVEIPLYDLCSAVVLVPSASGWEAPFVINSHYEWSVVSPADHLPARGCRFVSLLPRLSVDPITVRLLPFFHFRWFYLVSSSPNPGFLSNNLFIEEILSFLPSLSFVPYSPDPQRVAKVTFLKQVPIIPTSSPLARPFDLLRVLAATPCVRLHLSATYYLGQVQVFAWSNKSFQRPFQLTHYMILHELSPKPLLNPFALGLSPPWLSPQPWPFFDPSVPRP